MPRRFELLINGEIYHVCNRSSWNQELFTNNRDLKRALELIYYYQFKQSLKFSKYLLLSRTRKKEYLKIVKQNPLVEIFAFAFMPDHYHILLKQLDDEGIKIFASNFQNAFAKYFNLKKNNRGSLFINPFKAKRIDRDEIFLHVSRYIHLNPVTSYLTKIENLPYDLRSSYRYYASKKKGDLINTSFLIKLAGSRKNYLKFVENQIDYQRRLHMLKSFTFE